MATGIVDEAAKDFDQVIQAGWTGKLSSFSSLSSGIADVGNNAEVQQEKLPVLPELQHLDYLAIEKDHRWMHEEDYRAAWIAEGCEILDQIWD
ncbi:predicted protein [Plenodomus lingam JN3]|uniref:Uncharacterized protein n=1 Tax=Leptosphaeria maculans (strain JN3 / isolate v23.1.3 / race Av1-4-5-6-7-8) TaxID=985895 RepID=E5A6S2_LEPMJ|nr:predicted protein [Plenodomus lingam JN3]CBX99317.1 predicted protein [Plenodomus lingam JN3]